MKEDYSMSIGNLFKYNWAYLIWFIIYFSISHFIINLFVGDFWQAMLYTFLLYAVTLTLAFLPIGENILRMMSGARKFNKTNRDREYLFPIFSEVYNSSFSRNITQISSSVSLYIIPDHDINAFAIGRRTICVTRGAINALSEDELKGVIAHEFGHIVNGNTMAGLFTTVGNGFFSVAVWILSIILATLKWFFGRFKDTKIIMILLNILTAVFNLFIWCFKGFGEIILSLNSRYNEFQADRYAGKIGYKDNLIEALYILRELEWNKGGIKSRLTASHPYIDDRIERLERMK